MEKQYQMQTVTETISLEDCVMDSMAHSYTSALAQSMQTTRNGLLRQLLDAATISNHPFGHKSYEIKVDFDGKE